MKPNRRGFLSGLLALPAVAPLAAKAVDPTAKCVSFTRVKVNGKVAAPPIDKVGIRSTPLRPAVIIHTMDSASFDDFARKNSGAIAKALTQELEAGNTRLAASIRNI